RARSPPRPARAGADPAGTASAGRRGAARSTRSGVRRGSARGLVPWSRLREAQACFTMASPLLEPAPMDKVSFGHEQVSPEEKTQRVRGVFSSVARRYDIMNDLMSAGQHRLWKHEFVRKVRPRKGDAILDMAGGTGDIAFRMARAGASVTVADINPDMLAVGRERAEQHGIEGLAWSEQNAETLSFADKSFDAYTIAF